MGDDQAVRPFAVDAVSVDHVMLFHLVPSRRAGLLRYLSRIKAAFHVPDNVIVDQVDAFFGALDEDGLSLLDPVDKQV